MSVYSVEMLDVCRTVTRKVKVLFRRRWFRAAFRGLFRVVFLGLFRRRFFGGIVVGSKGRVI